MKSTIYSLWLDHNGWHGYLEGYPQCETEAESFQEVQAKLWQLHQDLSGGKVERKQDQPEHSEDTSPPPAMVACPISQPQAKRRARVEQLMFALISNP